MSSIGYYDRDVIASSDKREMANALSTDGSVAEIQRLEKEIEAKQAELAAKRAELARPVEMVSVYHKGTGTWRTVPAHTLSEEDRNCA